MRTPTQRLQVKKKVIKSPTSFYEYPFSNTAHYHILKRYNFSCLLLNALLNAMTANTKLTVLLFILPR